ncbi:hypothetical protein BDR07DRAFT_1499595 [Suillus spraguei]|nr:hypothetical protein BDR07DRAFT_1499595 [Suillus spraguei]
MKKHVRPIELEEKMAIEKKPSAKAAVGFSGDKEQQPPPAIDNAAMCIRGSPDVPKVAKGSQAPLTKVMHLLQEDEDSQNHCGAMHPETSVDCPTPAQVTEAPIHPVEPSSPRKPEHSVECTEGNQQSVHDQDVPPPLPRNPSRASSGNTRPSPVISSPKAPELRHADPYEAHNNHSHKPRNNRYLHGDLRPHQDNSPALHDHHHHPSDEPCGAYTYHKDLGWHAYARRLRPGGEYPYQREYSYYGDRSETYPGYAYAPHHESTGYHDATRYRQPYYCDMWYTDHELLDDCLHGPPLTDIHGEYMHATSHEGHVGYECAYQREPPQADGHHGSRSPIANAPLSQVMVQEQSEGGTIPR